MVRPAGLEPATTRLEGGCSIQLSYERVLEYEPSQVRIKWSEWRDSNPRHSAPKADALPGCATLRNLDMHGISRGAHDSHGHSARQRENVKLSIYSST
jgi:hypothetical protein